MVSFSHIFLALAILVVLYCIIQVIRVVQRVAPDKRGLTILEAGILKGNKILENPIVHPMSSLELVNSVIPVMIFFKENLDATLLKEALADCLDDVPLFRARVRIDKDRNLALLEAHNGGIQYKVQTLAGHDMETYKPNNAYTRGRSTYQVPIFLERLKLEKMFKGEEPLFRTVITHFETGGTVIGLSVSHLIFDVGTAHQFLTMWAERYSTRVHNQNSDTPRTNSILPVTDRTEFLKMSGVTGEIPSREELEAKLQVPIQKGSIGILSTSYVLSTTWHFIRRFLFTDDRHLTVHYSGEDLATIKKAASAACKNDEWVSSNDGVCSHIWHLVTRLQAEDPSAARKKRVPLRHFCMVINGRFRLEPALPSNFLGNIVLSVTTKEERETLLQKADATQLSQVALKLRQSMQQATPSYCTALVQWMQVLSPDPLEKMPLSSRGYFTYVPCHESYFMLTNCASHEMNFYNLQFGKATVHWVHAQGLYGCGMILTSPEDPNGLDLHLSLPPSISVERAEQIKNEMISHYRKTLV